MEYELLPLTENAEIEPVVIADECGDSMWDAVLQQENGTLQNECADVNFIK